MCVVGYKLPARCKCNFVSHLVTASYFCVFC